MRTDSHETDAGFTLLETVIVIAVLAILSAALTPALLQRIVDARIENTRGKAKSLYEAMVGRQDDNSNFGFVGDIGRLPTDFKELVESGALPLRSTQAQVVLAAGWNGPYINQGTSRNDALMDDFGHAFQGAKEGQVRSAGADGVPGNADDIVYPPTPPVIWGRLVVTVKTRVNDEVVANPPTCEARLFYPGDGVVRTLTALHPAAAAAGVIGNGPAFVFENVPMGIRSVQVSCSALASPAAGVGAPVAAAAVAPMIVAQEAVACPGSGRTKLVEMWY